MITIKKFVCNMLQENCYVVSDETKECVVIDCGAYFQEERQAIVDYIKDEKLTPKHLLATHGHIDHNFGNNTLYDEFGLKPEIASQDEDLINKCKEQARQLFNIELDYDFPTVGKLLTDGDTITFGSHTLKVISTPGHSRGSVCYYCKEENVMFSGDTLFYHSIGRTDFEGGSMLQIIQSLRMLAQMPDEMTVLSGHGAQTTIGEELAHNPYMDR